MKTKNCDLCKKTDVVIYRIKIDKSKNWKFVCKTCCQKAKSLPQYSYGGTWKGSTI